MERFTWDDGWRTGHDEVDAQHQELFRLINELEFGISTAADDAMLQRALDGLHAYVVVHFRTEEALMRRCGYPGYEEHRAIHEDLARQAGTLIAGYRSGRIRLTTRLTRFLGDWVQTHIAKEDLRMIRHVRLHGDGTPLAP